ncbi:hemerythrin domain-containing protein [Actinoplanes sp. DH11]|uniref:hemerythrin domain-containing protein n=1 Tax=Actinoplanes sp. DH11 TaxID=2857011 RepID=UPI001E58C3C0|nr:hemerythrin domain-containing protein [Actinoplanes sp. DH11]
MSERETTSAAERKTNSAAGREQTRLVAWAQEMRAVHARLRRALSVALEAADPATAGELLLYCRGFCAALDGHHRGEDRTLFPAVAAAHPHLRPVLRSLEQDHSMIAYLIGGLSAAVERGDGPDELRRHLEGVGAIMENHFRYEERQLLTVLETLRLDADPADALGPL